MSILNSPYLLSIRISFHADVHVLNIYFMTLTPAQGTKFVEDINTAEINIRKKVLEDTKLPTNVNKQFVGTKI